MSALEDRRAAHAAALAIHGQSAVLAFWPALNDEQRRMLLDDLDQVDLQRCAPLIDEYVRRRPVTRLPAQLEPAPAYPAEPPPAQVELYRAARAQGEALIRGGEVAAFTVAGGQGTRLGFDGPKGCFPASPVRGATLFQLFAEAIRGVGRRYGRRPRWYIMTSPLNHAVTVEYFERSAYFGLPPEEVRFFRQGQMPAFTPDGQLALIAPHQLALAPDGHGGSLQALARSGALDDMRAHGVSQISYFQVDNPLVKPIDPLFIGLHALTGSEMASKAVAKADDKERVGNFCLADGRLCVIEYSDLPDEIAHEKNADGSRRFDAGSIAIHVLSRAFVERVTAAGSDCRLPWHRADKTANLVDPRRGDRTPAPAPVVKLEMFVFDALPLARNPLVLMTPRHEEFSPIKNADGLDSPATARRDQLRRAAAWVESAGGRVARDPSGEPAAAVEISPAYALDAADLRGRLSTPLHVQAGQQLVLE